MTFSKIYYGPCFILDLIDIDANKNKNDHRCGCPDGTVNINVNKIVYSGTFHNPLESPHTLVTLDHPEPL